MKAREVKNAALGRAIGVSHVTIGHYRRGNFMPESPTLQKIAEFFGVSMDSLLAEAGLPERSIEQLQELPPSQMTAEEFARINAADPLLTPEDAMVFWATFNHLGEMLTALEPALKQFKAIQEKILSAKVAVNKPLLVKSQRTPLRDIDTVSLSIFGNIPAGWPQPGDGAQAPVRSVHVPRGRFPEGAFGLDVRGDSMNAARPEPILDGETVVLVSPEQREPRSGDIVAALIDGGSTLKRLVNGDQPAHLRSESTNPAFGAIRPLHDLTIQGVVIGKL